MSLIALFQKRYQEFPITGGSDLMWGGGGGEGGGHGVKNIVYKYLGDEEIPHQIYIFVLLCIKHILTHLPYIFEVIFLLHKRSFYYSLDSNHSMFIMILYYIM